MNKKIIAIIIVTFFFILICCSTAKAEIMVDPFTFELYGKLDIMYAVRDTYGCEEGNTDPALKHSKWTIAKGTEVRVRYIYGHVDPDNNNWCWAECVPVGKDAYNNDGSWFCVPRDDLEYKFIDDYIENYQTWEYT